MTTCESVRTKYVVKTTVVGVLQKYRKLWVSGTGKNAVFENAPWGWFVHLEGTNEAICLMGDERPDFNVGDHIRIVIEKA